MDIEKVAKLARIELTDAEKERFSSELDAILAYVEELAAVDTEGVEPTTHVLPLALAMRADEVGEKLDRAEVLAAAPAHDGHAFIVPKVL